MFFSIFFCIFALLKVINMAKILESEFRNNLYKGLVEAGYDKDEAQTIVGKKYFTALKEQVNDTLNGLIKSVAENEFVIDVDALKASFGELQKMNAFLSKEKK